jgi:hypothetical protein
MNFRAFAVLFASCALVNGCCGSGKKENEKTPAAPVAAPGAPAAASGSYAVGDRLLVAWKDEVYPAVVLAVVGPGKVKIHYEGFGNEWDEVVGPDRIKGRATGAAAPRPTAAPAPTPEADPNQMAADGFPQVIPEPGSKTPTVAEWNAVQREVRVKGSSARGCETKMVREWLRVSCRPGKGLPPSAVSTISSSGQQAYPGMFGNTASLVVQVVRGKPYRARFVWTDDAGNFDAAFLVVNWPANAARPTAYFEDDAH